VDTVKWHCEEVQCLEIYKSDTDLNPTTNSQLVMRDKLTYSG